MIEEGGDAEIAISCTKARTTRNSTAGRSELPESKLKVNQNVPSRKKDCSCRTDSTEQRLEQSEQTKYYAKEESNTQRYVHALFMINRLTG